MSKNGQNKYGHVGRPTNEEVKSRRNKIFLKSIFGVVLCLIAVLALSYFINGTSNKKLVANTNNLNLKKVFGLSTKNVKSNALQGSTGYGNKIYFSTSKSGAKNQKNYYSKIKIYDIKTKKVYSVKDFDKILSKMPTYKINDITTNTDVGRNYFILYDATNKNNSKIIFSTYNIVRSIDLDRRLTNIAYNEIDKKYYSLVGNEIYNFEIPTVSKTNKNENVGSVKTNLACNIVSKKGISSQGITIKDNLLLFSYSKSSNKAYTNYIDVYNIDDCKNYTIIKPSKTINLGTCKANSKNGNCVIESLFYINSQLYVGYNNYNFNNIAFYNDNVSLKNITASELNGEEYKATGYLGNPLNPSDTKRDFMEVSSAKCFPKYCSGGAHSGFDLNSSSGAPQGTKVYAMDSGIVSFAGTYDKNCHAKGCSSSKAMGLGVTIDHGNGYETSYLYFSKRVVNLGDKVKKGQLIGYVGNTGNSTGAHVHITLKDKILYSKYGWPQARGYEDRGLMNAAKYINKNVSYVDIQNSDDPSYKATGYLGNPLNPSDTKKDFMETSSAKCFPKYCSGGAHSGIDLNKGNSGAVMGSKVYAMDSGVVSSVGSYDKNCYPCSNAGISVNIDHGNGYETGYLHLSKRVVEKGQKVKKGELIGYVGNTGNSAGTHLSLLLKNKYLYSKYGWSQARGHDDRGLMNAAKYINKSESYVGKEK